MEVTIKACDRCSIAPGEVPEVAETCEFYVGDDQFEVDLCQGHKKEFTTVMTAVQAYTEAARPKNAKPARKRQRVRDSAHAEENRKIREWAPGHGIELGDRGRIPDEVRELWRAEQKEDA